MAQFWLNTGFLNSLSVNNSYAYTEFYESSTGSLVASTRSQTAGWTGVVST